VADHTVTFSAANSFLPSQPAQQTLSLTTGDDCSPRGVYPPGNLTVRVAHSSFGRQTELSASYSKSRGDRARQQKQSWRLPDSHLLRRGRGMLAPPLCHLLGLLLEFQALLRSCVSGQLIRRCFHRQEERSWETNSDAPFFPASCAHALDRTAKR